MDLTRLASWLPRASLAVAAPLLAWLLSGMLRPLVLPNPFIFFFAAVALSAWYGGLWPGLLSALLSLLLVTYSFLEPLDTFELQASSVLRAGLFIVVSLLIAGLSEARMQAERAAQLQRERFAVTLASIADAVIATDVRGRITFINAVASELTGWPGAEALGRPVDEVFRIVSEQTRDPVEGPTSRVLREGRVVGLANGTLLLGRDGAERPIDDSGAPIRDGSGRLVGTVLVFRDVTERAVAEAQQAALLAREQEARRLAEEAVQTREVFVSIAAHELRTPLTALMGQAQLLERRLGRETTVDERHRSAAGVVVGQARRLNRMVTALLDVSRLAHGRLSLDQVEVDLGALVLRVVAETRPTLVEHTLVYDVEETPLVVYADELRLEQVFQNLIGNAVKYSAPSEVRVRAWSDGGSAYVSIVDRGIGIPATALPHLFTRFYRAPNADDGNLSGMGVGLFVVKEIVTLHGGEVSVESSEGSGSTFIVRLPLHAA
jgi:PAS domain S-box-containing protein